MSSTCCFFLTGCFLASFFDPEEGGSTFIRNFNKIYGITQRRIPEHTTLHMCRILSRSLQAGIRKVTNTMCGEVSTVVLQEYTDCVATLMEVGSVQVPGLMSRPIYLAQAIASGSVNDLRKWPLIQGCAHCGPWGIVKFVHDIIQVISAVLKLNLMNFSAAASSSIYRTDVSSNGIHAA
jgi:hypothetical protein